MFVVEDSSPPGCDSAERAGGLRRRHAPDPLEALTHALHP
jgi:hypothetical protein